MLSAVSIGLVVWYGGKGILEGADITVGELIAFILFIHMMSQNLHQTLLPNHIQKLIA